MANSFNNFTLKIAEQMLDSFESKRVLSKNVNTQMLSGKFDKDTGDTFDFKRPTDYTAVETEDGDVSGETESDIITGRASGIVQPYITVFVKYSEAAQAIEMGNLKTLLAPMATRLVTKLETNMAKFMMKNTGLLSGTPGTAISTWDHVAAAGAIMDATGVPADDEWILAVNSFTQRSLASDQRSLGSGGVSGDAILEAHRKAILTDDFAGMKVMKANTLASYTTDPEADRVGSLTANPAVTYNAAKNTMTQSLVVANFGVGNPTIKAGETIQITDVNRLNLSTRELILDENSDPVLFTGTVNEDVTLVGGAGTIIITGPAIFETAAGTGAYNTSSRAVISGDVVTLLGPNSKVIQPSLFWHKNAFAIGSVPMERLDATDTFAETEDGIQIRVTRFSDAIKNQNRVRIDIRPAFAALNPFFSGQAFGLTP